MNKELIEQYNKSDGWIDLYGRGLDRQAFLSNTSLKPIAPEEFAFAASIDWGGTNVRCRQLAYMVLTNYMGEDRAKEMSEVFYQVIVSQLPPSNFAVRINLKQIINLFDNASSYSKRVFAHQFIRVRMGENYYSRLLDFGNMMYGECRFNAGTVEYAILKSMSQDQIEEITEYAKKVTKRRDPNDLKETLHTQVIGFVEPRPNAEIFVVRKGMGVGINEGLKLTDYEFIY